MSIQKISGLRIGNMALEITHLFFVDENLLITEAKEGSAMVIKELMAHYENALGQMVNVQKSLIFLEKVVDIA